MFINLDEFSKLESKVLLYRCEFHVVSWLNNVDENNYTAIRSSRFVRLGKTTCHQYQDIKIKSGKRPYELQSENGNGVYAHYIDEPFIMEMIQFNIESRDLSMNNAVGNSAG